MAEGIPSLKRSGKSKSSKKLAPLEMPSPTQSTMATSKSIESKRDLVNAVRRLNPAGTTSAPAIFWDVEGSLKTTTIDDSTVKQQVNIVENGVNYSAKRFNDLKVLNDRLTHTLKTKLDELDDQKKGFEQLDAMKNATTEEGIRLEHLETEIFRVEEDIYKKSHYSRQLEHVLERLKRNQLKFDAHMTGMEDTLRGIEKEGIEVRLLRKSLDAGLAKAVLVLEETQGRLANSRKTREVLLSQRKSELKNAQMLQEWIRKREEVKIQLALELRGDLTREEENFLKRQISEKVEKTKHLQKATEESHRRLQAMEDAFTKLKQVTGVSSLEEMHEKFSSQKSNKRSLEQEVKEAEARLLAAKKAHQKQEKIFQELKSSGGSVSELTREAINSLNKAIDDSKNEFKITRAQSERLSAVLLGLNQGSRGLLQRVQPYLHLSDGAVFELTQMEEDLPWAETLDALSQGEQVLAKMLEILNGENNGSVAKSVFEEDEMSREDSAMASLGEAPSNANNIRIKSRKILRELEWNNGTIPKAQDDESLNGDDKGNSGIGNVGGGNNNMNNNMIGNNNNDAMDGNDGVAVGVTGATNSASNPNIFQFNDLDVPSRLAVKKNSSRTSHEAKKKEEMEERQKKLTERMNGNGGDDQNLAIIARLKAQKAAGDRLCTVHHPPTLPDGVTLRDDVMTKTVAFLTKMPDLV